MRSHIQGLVLLIVLLIVFWVTWSKAGPVISDAFEGEDGAIVAESGDEVEIDPETNEEVEPPLTPDEIAELQSALTAAGYDPGPIDGIMGDQTINAATTARFDYGLSDATDRELIVAINDDLATQLADLPPDFDFESLDGLVEG